MLTGGCLCGAVRYEAGGTPFNLTMCHCATCRRASGAPLVAWFSVPKHEFRLVQGTPARFSSSAQGMRSFCKDCGSALTFENSDLPEEIDVTICTLDQPEQCPPADHTWVSRQLPWISMDDGLPGYATVRMKT
ncbi:GFA family protein [Azohydromonas lata]|uniref:GFA family protein n=1 Tax=Azohydromonas lata TaxID=45677 RepID=UPI000830039D|nr:GFA family protein [Azohydromonas lata]